MNRGDANPSGRPKHMSDYAKACLEAIAARGLGERISLGGASGLMHYLDYRPTNDVDAWWVGSPTAEEQRQVIRLVESTLAALGEVKTRIWGDVVSVELRREGKQVFSFQIARRSAQLEEARLASWIGVLVDSLADLVASKMVALVERGAPRDFRDIHALCQAGLITASRAWQLWRQRQQLAGSDVNAQRARLAVETHLARIAAHRPLEQIADSRQRAEAQEARAWFKEVFLRAIE